MMHRALVTGGAGFIGSHLVPRLLENGWVVSVLDDLSTGHRAYVPEAVRFVEGSITDDALVGSLAGEHDVVVHLAAIASVERSHLEPEWTREVNLDATLRLAQHAREAGVRRFVFASSAAVYGNSGASVQAESDAPAPASPYAEQKLGCEVGLDALAVPGSFDVRATRFFNVFGPRQDPASPYSGVIGIFTKALLEGVTLRVFGDGLQSRDFVYVGDVARVLHALAEDGAPSGPTPLNVGRGESVTLLALIEELERVVERSAVVEHGPEREGDVRSSLGDVSRLASWFTKRGSTWSPVALREGLAETVAWLRE